MKKKELTDIKGKSIKDLNKLVFTKKLEAKKSKMNTVAGKVKNLREFKNIRRDIAQILTVIKEKQIFDMIKEVKGDNKKEEILK